MRLPLAFGMGVLALLAGASPAAATGITVGPARQMIYPQEERAEVTVANPNDEELRVDLVPYLYDGEAWVESESAGVSFLRDRLVLDPGEQRTVTVYLDPSVQRCELVGAGFRVVAASSAEVVARGAAVAQLARAGEGGTEADCLAVLPAPPTTTAATGIDLRYGLLGGAMLAVVATLYLTARRRHRHASAGWDPVW